MTTISTADDLIEVLKSDDKVRSAVRRELLTEELLALPERFGKMVETQTAILEDIKGIREEQKSLREEQNGLREVTNAMLKTQTAMLKTQTAMLEDIKGIREEQKALREEQTALRKTHEADHKENVQSMHRFRGNYAVDAATKNTVGIAKHFAGLRNMRQIRCDAVSPDELKDLLAKCEDDQALSGFTDDDLDYFSQVDLAFGVMGRREREPAFYIAVEASYTGRADDVARAVVRARILGAITGRDTYAVVASVKRDQEIEGRVVEDAEEYMASDDKNAAFWYQIAEENMEPPSPR